MPIADTEARWTGVALDGPEIGALAVFLAGGLLLSWLCRQHPAGLPVIAPWEFSWSEYLAALVGLWWYARGLAQTPLACRPSRARQAAFVAGVGLTYAVLQTRFLYLAEHMFFLHRVQHLILHHLGPFLIALAWPGEVLARGMPRWALRVTRARAVRRVCRVVQTPVLAAFLFVGLIALWLIPPVQFRAMVDSRLAAVMDWSMLVDGIFFFCLVLDPVVSSGLSLAGRIVLALSVQLPQIALGGILVVARGDLYPWYDLCGRVFPGIDAQADQQLGAFVVLFPGGMMSALTALILLGRLWRSEQAATDLGASEAVARIVPGV